MLRAGKLRHRLTIQRKITLTPNSFGETNDATDAWSDLATVWGAVEPLAGDELLAAQRIAPEVTHRVTLRQRSSVTPRNRILWRRWPFTAVAATDVCTVSQRRSGFADGDRVRLANDGGGLPAGLAADTDYFVRDASALTFKLAATLGGGAAINITSAGTGTHYVGVRAFDVLAVLNVDERDGELTLACREVL